MNIYTNAVAIKNHETDIISAYPVSGDTLTLSDIKPTQEVVLSKNRPANSNKGNSKCLKLTNIVAHTDNNKSYKLHLVMDNETHMRLLALKAALSASSVPEVIRRALDAYELIEPADLDAAKKGKKNVTSLNSEKGMTKHLYVNVPSSVRDILDREKIASGMPYNEIIRHSLRVLYQLVRERDKLRERVQNYDGHIDMKSEAIKSRLLALI